MWVRLRTQSYPILSSVLHRIRKRRDTEKHSTQDTQKEDLQNYLSFKVKNKKLLLDTKIVFSTHLERNSLVRNLFMPHFSSIFLSDQNFYCTYKGILRQGLEPSSCLPY